jgi:two-component system chemotaxis response regulator CheB
MVRVLVVDDSLFMRTIVRDMLTSDPGIEVVGSAPDGIAALKMIEETSPDVMTLDIEMPRMDGLELLLHRKSVRNFPRTVMLSSLTSKGAEATNRAISLGADDFILKPSGVGNMQNIRDELITKIKQVIRIPYIERKESAGDETAGTIVVIGSSAGGPSMLDVVLSSFSSRLPAALVIAQHMPEGGFTTALAARLNRVSLMPVKETENGDILTNGQIYVLKAGYHGLITSTLSPRGERGGRIIHSRAPPLHGVRPAADKTLSTASRIYMDRTVAVLLSGMGNDGGTGCAEVKERGGTTIVAREEDCLVYGMARSALQKNCVDRVLPLTAIAGEITRLTR